jgi:transposase
MGHEGKTYYEDYAKGMTYAEIAKKHGRGDGAIAGAIHSYRKLAGIKPHADRAGEIFNKRWKRENE